MYEPFFGFRERPFELTPNPRYLVLTEGHRRAINNIEYAIACREGITVLIGEAGSGKTTVIRIAIERQPGPVNCVHLTNPALTRAEFFEMLAVRFDLSERARQSKTALLLELEARLRDCHRANEPSVLIVHEAQTLPTRLLEEIRLLANIGANGDTLLSVILAGQPGLAKRLDHPSIAHLKQRVGLWCELPPLTVQETAAYIYTRIQTAGGTAAQVFTSEAVKLIHTAAKGIPRAINLIADNALLAGLVAEQRPVTGRIVQDVCRDFRITHVEDGAFVETLKTTESAQERPISASALRQQCRLAAKSLKPLPPSDVVRLTTDAFPVETPAGNSHAVRPGSSRWLAQSEAGGSLAPDGPGDDITLPSLPRRSKSFDLNLSHKVVGAAAMSPASREQYRRLAATLHNGRVTSGVKVIMVTSAVGGEGKTLTAANLALTFSESYQRRVLLVDADLRRPSIHQLFLDDPGARAAHLAPHDQRPPSVSQVTPGLGILTIGLPTSAPMAELTSDRMERLLKEAREAFDWIVIDTPPVALLPDASLLASLVDGVILVVKAESTSLPLVQQAIQAIGRKKTLGFVLNGAREQPSSARYRYGEGEQLTPAVGSRSR